MQPLDPLTLPLSGHRLIEASAGTGKTYTITSLILRLLLGHEGYTTQPDRARALDRILVVTFTRAATEELRERVRTRLRKTREAFETGQPPPDDDVIAALLAHSADREHDLRRLQRAEQDLDLASVFTIHGFAQRVLHQHAFESGASFSAELDENIHELVQDATLDFWRERVYPLPPLHAEVILAKFNPASLNQTVQKLITLDELRTENVPTETWDVLTRNVDRLVAAVLELWREEGPALTRALNDIKIYAKQRRALPDHLQNWNKAAAGEAELTLESLDALSQSSLERARQKRAAPLPDSHLFDVAEKAVIAAQKLPLRLLFDALSTTRKRLRQIKLRSDRLGFDDLLRLLDEALQGTQRQALSTAIRRQYPVALIDEFQDTDPLQWRVFSTIYAQGEGGLFLIGDPKQAIYSFRGADIYAYIKAKRQIGAHYSLTTNYRSVGSLIEAVNRLFTLREDADPFLSRDDIPFDSVVPSGQPDDEPFIRHGKGVSALQFYYQFADAPLSAGAYRDAMARSTATHLCDLLNDALSGQAALGVKPLQPGDIAILVRDRNDAAPLKAELRRRGIPYVYQSRESVFQTQEAQDLYQILLAVLAPAQERRLKAAMGTALMGRSAVELDQLQQNEAVLLAVQERFVAHAERLQRQGVLPMFRQLLHSEEVPARLITQREGERRLTDCLHLIELLHLERQRLDSDEALLAVFARYLAEPNGDQEQQQLRLESDEARLQIVTLHKSKGLQYPIVYLPFVALHRETQIPLYHDAEFVPVYDFASGDTALSRADRERLAEDLRLLYVGVTRAIHACFVGLAEVKQGSGRSSHAIGHILDTAPGRSLSQVLSDSGFQTRFTVYPCPEPTQARYRGESAEESTLAAKEFGGSLARRWQVTSYSSLVRSHEADQAPNFRQPELGAPQAVSGQEVGMRNLFDFPRGARAGSFLHGLLENIDFSSVLGSPEEQQIIERGLLREGYSLEWKPVLQQMLDDVLGCDLDGSGLRLETVPNSRKQAEMGFDLTLEPIDAPRLNALLQRYEPLATLAVPLSFAELKGLLTGFIDLVFEHEGRFYVADYKSNYLGSTLEDYRPDRLAGAIIEHRYDLQYVLYSLALYRLLRLRLGDSWSYENQFGGIYYLFLRGMRREQGPQYGVYHTMPDFELIESLDRLFAREERT